MFYNFVFCTTLVEVRTNSRQKLQQPTSLEFKSTRITRSRPVKSILNPAGSGGEGKGEGRAPKHHRGLKT